MPFFRDYVPINDTKHLDYPIDDVVQLSAEEIKKIPYEQVGYYYIKDQRFTPEQKIALQEVLDKKNANEKTDNRRNFREYQNNKPYFPSYGGRKTRRRKSRKGRKSRKHRKSRRSRK
jgi:hypothetical protein